MKPEATDWGLRRIYGNELVDRLEEHLFEFAYQEAHFLGIETRGETFRKLCRLRRKAGLIETAEKVNEARRQISKQYEVEIPYEKLGEFTALRIPRRDRIPALIHKLYYPSKGLNS